MATPRTDRIAELRTALAKVKEASALLLNTNLDICGRNLVEIARTIELEVGHEAAWQVENRRPYYGG